MKKKISSVLLALLVFLMSAMTVFAAETNPDPEPAAPANPLASHTFTAYQIFEAKEINAAGQVTGLKWGSAITDDAKTSLMKAYGGNNAATMASELTGDNAEAFARSIYELVKNSTSGETVISGETVLHVGYYLIVDKSNLENKHDSYNLSFLEVADGTTPIVIRSKHGVPSVDKKIEDPAGTLVEVNEAAIGEDVHYVSVGTLPDNLADYTKYYYKFTDTLSKGLTYNDDMVIKVGDADVTSAFTVAATPYNAETGTVITVEIQDIKAISGITKDSEVKLIYSAKLNENAVVPGPNPNKIKLTYSNKPNESGNPEKDPKGETPEIVVETYTTALTILKTDDENQILPGAEFTLTGENIHTVIVTAEVFTENADGAYWKLKDGTYTSVAPVTAEDATDTTGAYESTTVKYAKEVTTSVKDTSVEGTAVSGMVDETNGMITFTGLGAGAYTIEETKVPAGYNKMADIEFTIGFAADTKTFTSNNELITVQADNTLFTTIVNESGSFLPSTGGIGTTIFYVIGGILVAAAGLMLVVSLLRKNK